MFGPCFAMQHLMSYCVCDHLDGEERAGFFTSIVFLMLLLVFCGSYFRLVGLQCVIVVTPDHTRLLFNNSII